jgi:peptidoglycan hydrolase CwlO-like protein
MDFDEIIEKLTSKSAVDLLTSIGTILAGIYYGITRITSKKSPVETNAEVIEADLIKILREHVDDESVKNKNQQAEIKELKDAISQLEHQLDELKKMTRRYEAYIDRIQYKFPDIPRFD